MKQTKLSTSAVSNLIPLFYLRHTTLVLQGVLTIECSYYIFDTYSDLSHYFRNVLFYDHIFQLKLTRYIATDVLLCHLLHIHTTSPEYFLILLSNLQVRTFCWDLDLHIFTRNITVRFCTSASVSLCRLSSTMSVNILQCMFC
jgi:hypothetical protein